MHETQETASIRVQIRDEGPVGRQAPEEFVAEATAEGPDGLGLRVAGSHPLRDVGAAGTLALELCDGDPVKGDVELTAADAVQPVTDRAA
jgi:hypothetical protein